MPAYRYRTNHEPVKCINCGNKEFVAPGAKANDEYVPYECARCHFVSWFPKAYAPEEGQEE